MKPFYKPYDNGIVPFTKAFNKDAFDYTVRGIVNDYRFERFSELMETHKWLKLCLMHTEKTIENYNKGIDIGGCPISKSSEIWRTEKLHFNSKKDRINQAIEICEKYIPFKE
jgi:hypothetical protein